MHFQEVKYINQGNKEQRLAHLAEIIENEKETPKLRREFSNNHIHTTFSFSPYSPAAAIWAARKEGLGVAGIVDHDTVGGADEFKKAAKIAGIKATCGLEIRVDFSETPFGNVKLNHPDQTGAAYMLIYGVKEQYFDVIQKRLAPLREIRNERNREMVKRLNALTGAGIDFERDVVPLSQYADGGAVTERHILCALAQRQLKAEWEKEGCRLDEYEQLRALYKRLGMLKSNMEDIYIPAKEELMTLDQTVMFAKDIDAILCYSYLGDVTESPTGDKAAAKYEDAYLDELLAFVRDRGIDNLTFAPSRNTPKQIERILELADKLGFEQISGEDINSPDQSFICPQLADPRFSHLVDKAYELAARDE